MNTRFGTRHLIGLIVTVAIVLGGFAAEPAIANEDGDVAPAAAGAPVQVAVGTDHACAIRGDTTISCWGSRGEPAAGSGWLSIAAANHGTCAVTPNNLISCWRVNKTPPPGSYKSVVGSETVSQGDYFSALQTDGHPACWGSTVPAGTPTSDTFSSLSAGYDFVCGVRTNQSLKCWGNSANTKTTPPSSGAYIAVSAGVHHACAIKTDHTLACWGRDLYGEAGQKAGQFSSVGAGLVETCAVLTTGALKCWGSSTSHIVESSPGGTFGSVVLGSYLGGKACGVHTNGSVVCWPGNSLFPPAAGFQSVDAPTSSDRCGLRVDGTLTCWDDFSLQGPQTPKGGFLSVESGYSFSCGLKPDHIATCWGEVDRTAPTGEFESIAAGVNHACGVRPINHSVECWGTVSAPFNGQFRSISAGTSLTCGVKLDDSAFSAGTDGSSTPTFTGTFTSVSAGSSAACAIRKTDQGVSCWGMAFGGTPTGTFASVSVGLHAACGIKTDLTMTCWGDSPGGAHSPIDGTFSSVSAAYSGGCAVRTDSVLQCWGIRTALGGPVGPAVAAPKLSISDASVVEGASGNRTMWFTVSLPKPTLVPVSARFVTQPGSATSGSDYVKTNGKVTLPAGTTSATVGVPIVGDSTAESPETFTVKLSNPSFATLGDDTATGTIVNDDPGSGLRVSVGSASVYEGNVGKRSVVFTVSLTSPAGTTVSVKYATTPGSATAGTDYTSKSGTVSIAAGATSAKIVVPIVGDTTGGESNETFTVTLSSPSGSSAVLGQATGTGTITNDD